MLEIKRQALKSKDDRSFWSSEKCRKGFSKINDTVKSELQKWTISHLNVIPSPTENYHITFTFDDGIIGVNTELLQKVIFRVSVCELHIEIQKKLLGFPWHTMIM